MEVRQVAMMEVWWRGSWPDVMLVAPGSVLLHGATWHAYAVPALCMHSQPNQKQHRRADCRAGRVHVTYGSESESSVSRLLATLLCKPSESSSL
jgi:hypothetical protein